ncbi:hypothetical protein [Cupriavidus lacunae]
MGRVAPFGLLMPVFPTMSSVLFLGDRLTPMLVIGGAGRPRRCRCYPA